MRIAFERPDQPEVVALIDELDAYQKPLYPPKSHHGMPIAALMRPHVLFAVARTGEGEAAGCGAVVLNEGWGELKRMYVRPALRGRGIAQGIIAALEGSARERGLALMRLETGVSQPEALRLYERAGYARRGPFGGYGPDPLSVFMEKHIGA